MNHKISHFRPLDYLELFLTTREEANREPGTIACYRLAIERLLSSPAIPDDLQEIEPAHVLMWLKELRLAGMSASYRAWHQRHTWVFLHWLYLNDYVPRDPRRGIPHIESLDVKRPQMVEAGMSRLMTVAIGALKKNGEPKRYYYRDIAIVRLLWSSGMRVGEVTALQYADIDLERKVAFVSYAKGKKQREAPFDVATKRALLEYILRERGKDEGSLFRMTANAVRFLLRRLAARAKTDAMPPHAFRRGFARRVRRMGMDLGETAQLLGHATLEMARLYSAEGEQEAAMEAYRRLIG